MKAKIDKPLEELADEKNLSMSDRERGSMPNAQSQVFEDMKVQEVPDHQVVSMESDMERSPTDTGRAMSEVGMPLDAEKFKVETARCILEVKVFIHVIKETVVRFYQMEDRVQSRVAKEQLENFITSQILAGPLYILIFNLVSLNNFEQM